MKRTAFVFAFLLSVTVVPLYAIRITSAGDVIRMHRSGAAHAFILEAIERSELEVTPADVVAMRDAGLPEELIGAVLDNARSASAATSHEARSAERDEPANERAADEEEGTAAGDDCITYEPPIFISGGWFIPRWLWDPHWFMPRLYEPARTGGRQTQRRERAEPQSREVLAPSIAPRVERDTAQPERSSARAPLERAVKTGTSSPRD